MKKILYSIFCIATLMLSACEDTLEVKSQSGFDDKDVYSNYTLAEKSIFSIYEAFMATNGHRGRYLPYYGFNTDIEWYNGSADPETTSADGKQRDLAVYMATFNNGTMVTGNSNVYSELYTGVERANLCIKGLREYGEIEHNSDLKYLLGEALTIRAALYWDLVKAWGDVPARFEPVESNTIYIGKSDRDVIYKQLIADLQEAANYVPWPKDAAQTQTTCRVNKAYTLGLLSRICLAASGYAQRPDVVNGGGAGSAIRLSNDPELTKDVLYPIALNACKEVINSHKCLLESNYEQMWKNNSRRVVAAGGEIIFVVPFSSGRGRWLNHHGVKHAEADQFLTLARGGSNGPVPHFFFEYDQEDIRRDVTCINYQWKKANVGDALAKQTPSGINAWYFGKYRYEWMDPAASLAITDDDGVKPVYMRYADILLMAAECANYLGDLGTAKNYLLQVRERAFANNKSKADTYVNSIGSKEDMFNAIVNERALEFCGEFLRKADLIRWNLLKSKMDEAKQKMTSLSNLEGNYADLNPKLYFWYASDGVTLITYGLNRGEVGEPTGVAWTSMDYISGGDKGKLNTGKIRGLYWHNPDERQYWPIFNDVLNASLGYIKNDYGY